MRRLLLAVEEQRTITQVCEKLLNEGVEAYKKEGPKFMPRLVIKQKAADTRTTSHL